MKPKVLFLRALEKTKIRENRCVQNKKWNLIIYPPLEETILATLIKPFAKVKIVDSFDFSELKNYDFIVTQLAEESLEQDLMILKRFKHINLNLKTIIYGPFATFSYNKLIKHKEIDYIIYGEPENPLKNLFKTLNKNRKSKNIKRINSIKGIITKEFQNPIQDKFDLKNFVTDWSLVDLRQYKVLGIPFAMILTGRGCRFNCNFCVVPRYFGHKIRKRNPEDVIKEIKYIYLHYHIRHFWFYDESLMNDKKFFRELMNEIIKLPFKIKIITASTLIETTIEDVKLYKKAGGFFIAFGIESTSDKVLKIFNKVKSDLKKLNEISKNINTLSHIILGFGDEIKTFEDLFKTKAFMIDPLIFFKYEGIALDKDISATERKKLKRLVKLFYLRQIFSWRGAKFLIELFNEYIEQFKFLIFDK